jgi:type III restriction enzyme
MALHRDFPKSPYAVINPELRWFPADESLRTTSYDRLLPPLVAKLRKEVYTWRDSGYAGASETSKTLLRWWFLKEHPITESDGATFLFRYYFAQREALETIIWLYEVAKVHDKYDLMRYDSSGAISTGMIDEDWPRYVVKMATGSGKTKVLSLVLAWSYFHKLYETDSELSQNFLIITPNIIVLDRIRTDFEGLKIFFSDPVLPDNGHEGQDWRSDFQPNLHIQDEIGAISNTGNIFLTNIHRVYEGATESSSFDDSDTADYFLGKKPVGATNESKLDVGDIVRSIDELVVLNDEAHHIHDPRLAWFKAIEDIHNKMKMKGGKLALQVDTTATPKHENGAIFVQTVCDYPLVEAIYQDVVKHPVIPEPASRAKLQEHKSAKYTEKYKDYIHLGYLEWEKVYNELLKDGKKAVLFLMTDDTKNCDEVAEYLESSYPDLNDAVLVIHTNKSGEISESVSRKNEEDLRRLRDEANKIDSFESQYKAIVSVMMLKEGWDVRNVTTIVGLRPYTSKSNILPEQTLGRGLRRMYRESTVGEFVSVVGTDAFIDFVESIKTEGVELETKPMGAGTKAKAPLVIEIDNENVKKDIQKLDLEIPVLTPRIYREYKNLSDLDVSKFGNARLPIRKFSEKEKREIVFWEITDNKYSHTTQLDTDFVPNFQSIAGYFTQIIMKELCLVSSLDILYEKLKLFITNYLFNKPFNIEDTNDLRNLSEIEAVRTIIETFKQQINELTVLDKGEAEIRDYLKVSKSRPFVVSDQAYIVPKKSPFNRIVGDSHFELQFASFLDECDDVVSYAKNYFAVNFRIEYRNTSGEISNYYPDFIVKISNSEYWIVETKGRENLDDIEKIKRLKQWCVDVNANQKKATYNMLYIKQEDWEKRSERPKSFSQTIAGFR